MGFHRWILAGFFIQCCQAAAVYSRFDALPSVDPGRCGPQISCDPNAKYRTFDGTCTNTEHPHWAKTGYPYARFLPARFSDGKLSMRKSVNDKPLPTVRRVSYEIFPDRDVKDKKTSLNFMQWMQVIAHDVTLINDRHINNGPYRSQCCTLDHHMLPVLPEGCIPVELSADDPFYSHHNTTCLFFVRGEVAKIGMCSEYPIEVANTITSALDGSFVYGSSDAKAKARRSFVNGKLKAEKLKDGRFFPNQDNKPFAPCLNTPPETRCYDAGDPRVNMVTGMTIYHVLGDRLHNIICEGLLSVNPSWDDERIYQEARRILSAIVQHITYKEYLPIFLGKEYAEKKGLLTGYNLDGCENYYDPSINPSTTNEFAAGALRSVHSMVPREMLLVNKSFEQENFLLLDDYFLQPYVLEKPGIFEKIVRGLAVQPHQALDEYFSVAVTRLLFKKNIDNIRGDDTVSLDIYRGRELGLPTYNEMRELFGLRKAEKFQDFQDVMNKESYQKLQAMYESVDDVDLFVGGMMEEHAPDSTVGPTFRNIMGEQFYRYMRGDRFYYENCGLPSSFTKAQLKSIYQTSNAWMFCVTGDNIDAIQRNVFYMPSESNPVVPCSSIPALDYSPWKE